MSEAPGPDEIRRALDRLRRASDEELNTELEKLHGELGEVAGGRYIERNLTDQLGLTDSVDSVVTPGTIRVAVAIPETLADAVDEAVRTSDELPLDLAVKVLAAIFFGIAVGAAAAGQLDVAVKWSLFAAFIKALRDLFDE